jgi:hypothetical protein
MLCLIGTEGCQRFHVHRITVVCQTLEGAAHGDQRVKDEEIRDQMVVLDNLALLIASGFTKSGSL